eukprot:CAMPEP_0198260156 /NCGR_PEP_ID=MMETSP1447-20131203/9192_1 /TAXON_ID=420782 /ORGANISM="Chaetoceros dichaeta, Strain CCMP1751" /LENGTH=801 /DNA_ID=CAMNT_0043947743 /DNA_START=173 /DNA_END=2575 /DNA_ORIENTATION=+
MKSFAIYLEESKKPEWKDNYLDYAELKTLLLRFAERRSRISLAKSPNEVPRLYPQILATVRRKDDDDFVLLDSKTIDRYECVSNIDCILERTAQIEREEFCHVLDMELDKVARFYLGKISEFEKKIKLVQTEVSDARQLQQESRTDVDLDREHNLKALIAQFREAFENLGDELLDLNLYVGANIIALRQILIRYDSMIRTHDGPPLGQWYIVTRRGIGNGYHNFQFESLFIHYGLTLMAEEMKFTLKHLLSKPDPDAFDKHGVGGADFKRSFRQMSFRDMGTSIRNLALGPRKPKQTAMATKGEKDVSDGKNDNSGIGQDKEGGVDRYIREFTSAMANMEALMVKAEKRVDIAGRGRAAVTASLLHTLRYYFLAGFAMNEMLIQPSFLKSRGISLKREMRFFAKWRSKRKIEFEMHETPLPKAANIKSYMKGPLLLNLISQMFYMMNHYIIEPSSTEYIHALGGNDAMSGVMISMAPWAALISALAYSLWSNKSYRQPLICSGFFLVSGSLMYASALRYKSIALVMSGRFMSGLGAPCGVNIRYIADTVPIADRTAVSAIFMTVSALGMSMGPGLAVLLDFLDVEFYVPFYGQVLLNGMTGPGYLMFMLWSVYLVVLILTFKDGERVGLHEMAEKERMSQLNADTKYNPPLSVASSGSNVDYLDIDFAMSESEDGSSEGMEAVEVAPRDYRKVFNQATVVCMGLKIMGKFNLEVLNCSTSLMTTHRYNWTVKNIGLLGFVNGCLVIPITMFVGFLSQYHTDQKLLLWLLGVAFIGVALLLDPTDFFVEYDDEGYNYQIKFW